MPLITKLTLYLSCARHIAHLQGWSTLDVKVRFHFLTQIMKRTNLAYDMACTCWCSNDMVGKELINQFILVNWAVCSALPPWLPTLPHLGLPVQTCMTTDRGSLVSTECRPTVDNQTIDVYLETKNIYTKKEHFISRINCLHFILYNVF